MRTYAKPQADLLTLDTADLLTTSEYAENLDQPFVTDLNKWNIIQK